MKISTFLLAARAGLLREETGRHPGASGGPAPPRPSTSLEPGRTARAPRPRLANLRFPTLPPPLS